jgi:O-Antigen ligase
VTYYQPPQLDNSSTTQSSAYLTLDEAEAEQSTSSFWRVAAAIYLISLFIPFTLSVGPITFTLSRLVLTVLLIPSFVNLLATGRILATDILLLLYGVWAVVCFSVNQGILNSVEPAGSHFIEVCGSYFLARAIFRQPSDYVFWSKCLWRSVLILLPFAIYEALTGHPLILEFLRNFIKVYPNDGMPLRLGLDRVQATFEHPILYGVFCASVLSPAVLVLANKRSIGVKFRNGFVVSLATFLSLSTGAYINLVWQFAAMFWNKVFRSNRKRWRLLLYIAIALYVAVDLYSNRTPFEVFISYLTFDQGNSYTRVLQWKYGTVAVLENPIFGLGLFADYPRPDFLPVSIDNFWLLRAMRFGFPGISLLLLSVIIGGYGLTKRIDNTTSSWAAVSTAQLCTLIGSVISLVTVDVWSGSHTFFYFSLGAIVALNQSFNLQKDNAYQAVTKPDA